MKKRSENLEWSNNTVSSYKAFQTYYQSCLKLLKNALSKWKKNAKRRKEGKQLHCLVE